MKVLTTGSLVKVLGITKDRYFRLEETGKVPPAKRTSTGKRIFFRADVERLKRRLAKIDEQRRAAK